MRSCLVDERTNITEYESTFQTSVCHPIILYLTLSIHLYLLDRLVADNLGYYSCFSSVTELKAM